MIIKSMLQQEFQRSRNLLKIKGFSWKIDSPIISMHVIAPHAKFERIKFSEVTDY